MVTEIEAGNQWADDPSGWIISPETMNAETRVLDWERVDSTTGMLQERMTGVDALNYLYAEDDHEHDMATMGSNRNDSSLLSDDCNSEIHGGLTDDPKATNTFQTNHGSDNHCGSDADRQDYRADDEVKNGQAQEGGFDLDRDCVFDNSLVLPDVEAMEILRPCSIEIAPSARLASPVNVAGFDNVQPDTQRRKKRSSASGSTKTIKERKRNNLMPPTIPGHKWKPSGKTGYELYTRQASVSENGKRSSTGKYIAYYSLEAIRKENAKRKKTTKRRRIKRQS